MIQKELCIVTDHEQIADSIFKLTVSGEIAERIHSPGQFVHIRVGDGFDPLLRRPISISSVDVKTKRFTMIYRKEGRGTTLLSEKKSGMTIDILGPLGNGFPVKEASPGDTALLVGGGIGVPPLYQLSRQLNELGVRTLHVLGFQTASSVFYEQEFARLGDTYITTADGTYGYKGFVTELISEHGLGFNILYACGPVPMLRALEKEHPKKKVYLSLEERMGCGIGACFACVCRTADDPQGTSYKKVCSDGPVFRAGEVLF